MREFLLKFLTPIAVFSIPLVFYLLTLSHAVAPGDSTEMVTAAIVLGVPHQPSYPLNTILGHMASNLPLSWGKLARVNAVSSVLQALTVVVFWFLTMDLFGFYREKTGSLVKGRLAAFAGSLFLAFSLVFWQYATKFEVFPLNNLLVVCILWLSAKIGLSGESESRRRKMSSGMAVKIIVLAFLAGFAFTHHQTVVLAFPTVLLFLRKTIGKLLGELKLAGLSVLALVAGTAPFFGLLIWIVSRKPVMNWGEIEGLEGAFAALVRKDFGTFSSYLVGFEPEVMQPPIEQVSFYIKHLVFDFSIAGVVFVLLGVWFLWKQQRRLFWFVATGLMSGILFLIYANFPLADSFNQATVRRFHLLPHMFSALFLGFGVFYIEVQIAKIRAEKLDQKLGVWVGRMFLLAAVALPLYMNFAKADQSGKDLTLRYARQAYADTPRDALIMLSGDIPNMTMDYFRMVEAGREDQRITFTPGQFHLDWFKTQLARRYPDLIVPPPVAGRMFTTATQVVDANYGRRPIYVGPDLVARDPELDEKYTLYPKRLLFLVKKKGEDLKLEEWRQENDKLWAGIDFEQIKWVRENSPLYEETVVFHYARHFFNAGFVYEEVGLYEDAIREYERVLEINPGFREAWAALARIKAEKQEDPDYLAAMEYLQNYISVLGDGEGDYAMAAQSKIYEYREKMMEELEEEAKMEELENGIEATASAQEEGN